jgi:hypothetical protein
VHCFESVIIHDMKLGTDVIGSEIANEANGACVQRGCSHVLSLPGPRFPLWHFPSILEPRCQDVHGAPPGVSIHEGTKRGLRAGPNLMGSKTR